MKAASLIFAVGLSVFFFSAQRSPACGTCYSQHVTVDCTQCLPNEAPNVNCAAPNTSLSQRTFDGLGVFDYHLNCSLSPRGSNPNCTPELCQNPVQIGTELWCDTQNAEYPVYGQICCAGS
jgi:hypothetical protein